LESRGLLIESPPRRGMFQILTPHAIATVRGTVWAVDVSPARSSVFVREGAVDVRRRHGEETVTLRGGDGVDVDDVTGLEVKRWSAERAARLLARFGR
jgi:ferric-dicitrate binding protein FerR (iron transport regulator)